MGGKSSTTSQTVEIPPEVREQYKTLIARGNQLTQKPFQAYSDDPTAFVAPLTATQQAGIANINAMQGMAQPSIEQGQGMIMQGIGAAAPLQGQSLDTAAQGRAMGTQLFGGSLDTAAAGTGAAGDIFGQALPAIQQAVQTGAAYGADADPYLRSALGAAAPLMGQGAALTNAGLGAGAGFGAMAADYLGGGTKAVDPTAFSGEQIDKYMSPYLKNVVEAQQALQQEEAASQRSALKGQQIAAGAFGGDRGGIAQANLARQQSLANQATLANLLQGGYGQALGAFQQQQGVDLAAQQANRQAQQFGSQQAAALGQQLFGQNLAAGSQLANIGQALFGQNIGQGQALANLGQQLYAQGLGGAQTAAGIGTNIAQMKAQEAALQQQAAQGVFGQAAQEAALQQAASNNIFNMANQGGMNYANLGVAGQSAALQGAQAQLAAGQIEQQTEQAAKSAMYNQFLQQQGFPYQQLGFLGNLSMGIGSQSGGTTTTQQGSYSDRRLKEDVRKVGETFDGQPIYSFKYKGEEKSQLGLIAQEVEKSHPEAVGERNGFLTVDYQDATEDAAKRGHFAAGGLVPSRLGGAVMQPGDFARGGYAEGGWTQQPRNEEDGGGPQGWVNEKTGEVKYGSDPNIAEAQAKTDAAAAAANVDPRIKDLYQKYMFRDPDAAGGQFWQKALEGGTPIEDIEADIANSRERNLVNQKPLTYNASNFGTPSAPVQNRYGFYSAPISSSGSSFTPQAIASRQPQTGYGKGPSTSSYTPAPRYGAYTPPPVASGKGPSTNAYTGTGNRGYSGMPTATGKGPSSYASGGRVAFAGGGASAAELKDYIDTMAGSPKGLAMAHKSIFSIPGEGADITKYTEGMVRSRGSNIPQPGRIPERKDPIKEAADFGTNVAKIAELGSKAKTKVEEWAKTKEPPKQEGSSSEVVKPTGAKVSEGPSMQPQVAEGGGKDMLGATRSMAGNTFKNPVEDYETPDPASFDVASLNGLENIFANGGRIHKQSAGGVFGKQEDEGSMDPSEGAYDTTGPGLDIEFQNKNTGSSFAKDATQRLLKGGANGTSSSGGSLLGSIGTAISLGTTAFKIGSAIATYLPMIFSDERLKKHAKPIGRLYDGQTVYRYDMDGETKIGLLAQEVEKKEPDAVGLAGKYKAVDYELATAKAAKRGHFYGGGGAFDVVEGEPAPEEIKVAGLSPSRSMTLDDATFKDGASSPDPVGEVVASIAPDAPTAKAPEAAPKAPEVPTGLKPVDDRHADIFGKMLQNESGGRQFGKDGKVLVGKVGEEGISQIRPAAAKEAAAYLGVEYDPERVRNDKDYNMRLGKAYFNMQLDRFGGDPIIAAAAYNAGPARVTAAIKKAEEQGGDYLDHLPITTVKYLSNLSDAALGAHQKLLERQRQVEAKSGEGGGPEVVNAVKPGLAGGQQTASAEPGLGAGLGPKRDWDLVGSKILPDAVPKSADFWVPLIAAVGGMLGARAPNMMNAIGAGLTAGASAYMKREEFQQEALKNSLGMIEKRFLPIFGEGDLKWLDTMTNRKLTDQQYSSIIGQFPGMPRIEPTRVEPAGGLAPAAKPAAKPEAAAPAGGLAPAGESAKPAEPTGVSPPRVEAPAPAAPAPAAAPAPGEAPAPVGATTEPQKPEKPATIQTNVAALEIPLFNSQPEADAWVTENADRLFKNVDPSRDPRTYIQRARQERAREEQLEKRIAALSGDPRPAAKEQIAQLRVMQQNAETERGKATDAANKLIEAASALAMARSKARMETSEAVDRERQMGKVKTEEALELERGKRDIAADTTLREVQPRAGGPTVMRTEKQILEDIRKNGSAPSDAPGAGNPSPGSPPADVVSKQPGYIDKRMELNTENEMKMGQMFKERQPTKQRFDNLIKIVEAYQTGAFAEFKQDAIRWARGLGFDISATDTADPVAFQVFRKNAVNGIIEQAKGLAGPIAFKELDLIGKANVDASMEPAAVAKLLAEARGLMDYEDQYYKDYANWRKDNKENPYPDFDFNIGWVEKNPTAQYIENARKEVAALGQKLPSRIEDYKHGQKYIIRQGESFGPAYWDVSRKVFTTKKPNPLGE